MQRPSPCSMRLRFIASSIGVVVGVSVFFCFGLAYDNWNTAIWGGLSGVFAAMTLALHVWFNMDAQSELRLWAHRMRPLMIVGCFIQLAGVCGIVAYLTVAILEHQDLVPEGRGFYLTSIWCFMTWKWGFVLFLYARQYRKYFRSRYRMDPDLKYEQLG